MLRGCGLVCGQEAAEEIKRFGMVHKTLTKVDETEEEYRDYICSIGKYAEEFERATRGHWGVEVNLHRQLDFTHFGMNGKNKCFHCCLPENEIMKLFQRIKMDYKNHPDYITPYAIEVAYYTGMRAGEISALTCANIDFQNKVICVEQAEVYDPIKKICTYTYKK